MTFISKEELLKRLEKKYEDLNDDSGCSCWTSEGYEWLSIRRIVDIIDSCDTYDDK